ncbi:MAG: VOC family protein [Nocardioides sp.]
MLVYVDDVASATALYTRALGLVVRFAHPSGDYTEFETGTTTLALCGRATAAQSTGLELTRNAGPAGNVTLVYDDVPASYARAVEAGAIPVREPVTKPWGQMSSYVLDNDANLIEIASAVEP